MLANQAHLDPRVRFVANTPIEPESLVSVPLIARGRLKGTLNIYRVGERRALHRRRVPARRRFGDAAALALDNAHIRASLELQAQTDGLTGLFNHRAFHELLRKELLRASAAHATVALVMLDLDDFKRVNDVYGHAIGDTVLAEVADLLRAAVRARRHGLPDRRRGVRGRRPGRRRRRSRSRSPDDWPARLEATSSSSRQGASASRSASPSGPIHAANPRELVACAEAAMMTAKARGKNRVVVFDEDATERPDATV